VNPAGPRELTSKNTHNVVAQMLLREPGCSVIMDIPCGKGAFAKRMAEQGRKIIAADCSGDPGLPGVRYVEANMDRPLSLADGELDAVACIDGIEHIERQFDFIRECRRIIRPGGCIVISTPNISSLRSRARWLATGFHNKGKTPLDETDPNPMHHINLISFPELRYLLHTNGFEITEVATNRIKGMNWLYAGLVPLAHIMTRWVFRKEARGDQERRICSEVMARMLSTPVLFGETLIVKAVRRA
jgi:2-polyprenyl-3-methyl-5-hydroxy-6-metoxy-1,4-benzoquinol methylase